MRTAARGSLLKDGNRSSTATRGKPETERVGVLYVELHWQPEMTVLSEVMQVMNCAAPRTMLVPRLKVRTWPRKEGSNFTLDAARSKPDYNHADHRTQIPRGVTSQTHVCFIYPTHPFLPVFMSGAQPAQPDFHPVQKTPNITQSFFSKIPRLGNRRVRVILSRRPRYSGHRWPASRCSRRYLTALSTRKTSPPRWPP